MVLGLFFYYSGNNLGKFQVWGINNGNPRQGGLPQIWYFPFEPSHAAEEAVYAFLTITYQYFYSDECSWIRKWKLHQKVSGHDFQAAFIQATSRGIIHSAEDCSNFSRSSEYSRRPDCGFPRHSTIVFPPHFPHLQTSLWYRAIMSAALFIVR